MDNEYHYEPKEYIRNIPAEPSDILDDSIARIEWWSTSYNTLRYKYNELIDTYNYQNRDLVDSQKMVDRYVQTNEKLIHENHRQLNLLNNIRQEIIKMFRRKIIKDVKWWNRIVKEIDKLHIYNKDFYTAKAVINIDGVWLNDQHNETELKDQLVAAINQVNYKMDYKLNVEMVTVDDIFDVEEFTENDEG